MEEDIALNNLKLTWDENNNTTGYKNVKCSIRVDGNDNSGKEAVLAVLVSGEESSVKEAKKKGLTDGVMREKKLVDVAQKICVTAHFHCSQASSSGGKDTVWEQNMGVGNPKLIMVVKDDEMIDLEALINSYKNHPYFLNENDIIFISLIPFPADLDEDTNNISEIIHSKPSKVEEMLKEMCIDKIKGYYRLCSELKADVPTFATAISLLLTENQRTFTKSSKPKKEKCNVF